MIGYAPPVTSTYVALCFFFNDTATTEIYTLSLHDALPICTTSRQATEALGIKPGHTVTMPKRFVRLAGTRATGRSFRSEEHTSELQSRSDLVCRLLLEKKKNILRYGRAATGRKSCALRFGR